MGNLGTDGSQFKKAKFVHAMCGEKTESPSVKKGLCFACKHHSQGGTAGDAECANLNNRNNENRPLNNNLDKICVNWLFSRQICIQTVYDEELKDTVISFLSEYLLSGEVVVNLFKWDSS